MNNPNERLVMCKGKNCNAVNGRMHSRECRDEHDSVVHYGAGNRNSYERYLGYKGKPLPEKHTQDQHFAWLEGYNAREDT